MGPGGSERGATGLDAADLWALYGRHAALIFGSGPTVASLHLPASFAVFSGADHVDLNQVALFGDWAARRASGPREQQPRPTPRCARESSCAGPLERP